MASFFCGERPGDEGEAKVVTSSFRLSACIVFSFTVGFALATVGEGEIAAALRRGASFVAGRDEGVVGVGDDGRGNWQFVKV